MKKFLGFTLAEVLITLGIIGVVAAITIPGIITKCKRIVLESKFKRAVSVMNQSIKLWQEDEDADVLMAATYANTDNYKLRKAFYRHLKGHTENRFNGELQRNLKQYYTSAKGSNLKAHYCPFACCLHPAQSSFVTYDGIMYFVCIGRDEFINFAFDINGYDKGPNKWGVDLFDFDYDRDNDALYNHFKCGPGNCATYYHNKSTNVNDGIGCTHCALKYKDYFKKIDI